MDDSKKFWLIDWEFSGMNSPFLDLANLSKNNKLSEDDDNFILAEYFGDSVTSCSIYKFQAFKCISLLNELLWSMLSEKFSEKVFDYKSYTDKISDKYYKQSEFFKSL